MVSCVLRGLNSKSSTNKAAIFVAVVEKELLYLSDVTCVLNSRFSSRSHCCPKEVSERKIVKGLNPGAISYVGGARSPGGRRPE